MAGYMALETLVEQGVWKWVRREKPPFAFNAILPGTVMGECLDPKNQGIPSTAGMVQWVWENKYVDVLNMKQPQWHVDARDCGKLFVAVLASSPRVDRERIYAFGDRYSWFKVAEILRRLYPEHADKVAKPKNTGWDQAQVPSERGKELLQRVGQEEWTGLEESVKENAESWLRLEKQGVTDHKHPGLLS
jgi:nucleoside-diphosphate-sugar epimerase